MTIKLHLLTALDEMCTSWLALLNGLAEPRCSQAHWMGKSPRLCGGGEFWLGFSKMIEP